MKQNKPESTGEPKQTMPMMIVNGVNWVPMTVFFRLLKIHFDTVGAKTEEEQRKIINNLIKP